MTGLIFSYITVVNVSARFSAKQHGHQNGAIKGQHFRHTKDVAPTSVVPSSSPSASARIDMVMGVLLMLLVVVVAIASNRLLLVVVSAAVLAGLGCFEVEPKSEVVTITSNRLQIMINNIF